eukprot:322270_1
MTERTDSLFVNFKQLKQISQRTQDIVFGYIREIQKDHSFQQAPELIGFVCLAYYYLSEYFDTIGANAEIDEEKTTITNTHKQYRYASAYGRIKILSTETGIHKWKFKINGSKEYMSIGIEEDGFKNLNQGVHFRKGISYALMCTGGTTKNGKLNSSYLPNGYKKGDIVEIILNLSNKTISFIVNDQHNGEPAYKNILQRESLSYRMIVCTFDKGDGATLLDYSAQ